MAGNPIFQLLSSAQRALVPFFESALEQGFSANRAIEAVFRGPLGPGIRRSVGLELARAIQPRIQFRRRLENVGRGFIPTPSSLPIAIGRILEPVVARFKVITVDGAEAFVSLGRDTVASRATLEEEMAERLAADPRRYPMILDTVRLVDLVQAGPAGVIPR